MSTIFNKSRKIFYIRCMRRLLLYIGLLSLLSPMFSSAQPLIQLTSKAWTVSINPSSLLIETTPTDKKTSILDQGVGVHDVIKLHQSNNRHADWVWKKSNMSIHAELVNDDLKLSFSTTIPQSLLWMQQPTDKLRKGMIWPLGEGSYAPSHSKTFSQYFASHYVSPMNTTEDLSLPLWEMDYGNYSYSWLLLNPWNNTIRFKALGDQLLVSAEHTFTPLNLHTPFTVMLHLGTTGDKLSGAKRYRQWLQHTGKFVSMKTKLKEIPEGKKLLGAPQIYLWDGGVLLSTNNITDWKGLVQALQHPQQSGLSSLTEKMSKETRKTIQQTSAIHPYLYQKYTIIDGLNAAENALNPYQQKANSPSYIYDMQKAIRQEENNLFTLLKPYVAPENRWGGGFSLSVIDKLHKAGLTHLWLGLPDWRAAMTRPQVVSQAKKDGYVVATYDSYNTALSPKSTMDWLTAHMGATVYKACYIENQHKQVKVGFHHRGRYVSPECVMPYFKNRTSELENSLHLNGWFLDADATGMVYENYQPAYQSSQKEDSIARGKRLRYLGKKYHIIVGSEEGSSTQAANVFFGQGVDAPVFAWGNKAMFHEKSSKYFRGGYWPTGQPTLFFKSIPLQKEFAEVLFNPVYRVPLFQAVFHDSEITTFHWFNGLLKYKGVAAEREITQMLYAEPPLYHLNAMTASARIREIRYADKFFQPLGQMLATKSLVKFKWLNTARTLQETKFSDGTTLFANFDSQPHTIKTHRLHAMSLLEVEPNGKTRSFQSHLSS